MEKILQLCLRIAVEYHVTDIHFDIDSSDQLKVSMRVHGRMCTVDNLNADIRFFRYLLYRANLDVSNVLEPQTGRFETTVDGKKLSLRMSLLSGYHIASGVLRILNNHQPLSIQDLSSKPEQTEWMRSILNNRDGLFLFSGPTGSGKTTTLYTILNEVTDKKVFTLEDPVEVYSEKYVQLQINEKQNFGYPEAIKQLMRHDPDIIMIGEIRDSLAAEMAVRCALTGHLVLSTIHSSTCVSTIERMKDLGVKENQLSEVLHGISAQRMYHGTEREHQCIYEIMNEEEVKNYFNTGEKIHKTLQEEILDAVSSGIIEAAEAETDLS